MKKVLIRLLNALIEKLIYKQKQVEILNLRLRVNTFIDKTFYVGANSFFSCAKKIGELRIFENVVVRKSCNFVMYPNSRLTIHRKVFINNYCSVNCLGSIEIGENTLLGEGVKMYDHNHDFRWTDDKQLQVDRDDFKIGYIKIGRNCWIGSNVTILKDVEIGDNVIIGANCLIYKSVPANSIVRTDAALSVTTQPDVLNGQV